MTGISHPRAGDTVEPMRIGSLFSGYGGLDEAVASVFPNAHPAWFCEWDDAPSKILAHHWPDIPNHRDVTTIDWTSVEPVDIITGGSPCQDLSAAGKRAGMTEGTRSNLWVNMREAINQLHPQYVVWENVLGALSAEATSDSDVEPGTGLLGGGGGHLRALGRVLGDLTELGYNNRWGVVRASDIGAPHQRARVFLLATPTDASRQRHGPDVHAGRVGRLDGSNQGEARERERPRKVTAHRSAEASADSTDNGRTRSWSSRGRGAGLAHGGNRDVEWGEYAPAIRRWERLTRPAPAPTEPNSNGGRRLNAAFAEWMMGLPEGHVTGVDISRSAQLKAIGNGVCPPQAAYALRQLLAMSIPTESSLGVAA